VKLNISEHGRIDYLRLALAFKALGGGEWNYDYRDRVLTASQRCYEILGIDENAAPINTLEGLRPHIHPEDVQRATEENFGSFSKAEPRDEVYHVDFRVISVGGEIRWIRSLACRIQETDSAHHKIIGCVADITDFRQSAPRIGVDDAPAHQSLTLKERECLTWVSLGKTAIETGTILGKSPRTIEFHLNNAVRKLCASNKIHAAALAIKAGLN
jgi:DNA-binding CsgD family transcriptional regulator